MTAHMFFGERRTHARTFRSRSAAVARRCRMPRVRTGGHHQPEREHHPVPGRRGRLRHRLPGPARTHPAARPAALHALFAHLVHAGRRREHRPMPVLPAPAPRPVPHPRRHDDRSAGTCSPPRARAAAAHRSPEQERTASTRAAAATASAAPGLFGPAHQHQRTSGQPLRPGRARATPGCTCPACPSTDTAARFPADPMPGVREHLVHIGGHRERGALPRMRPRPPRPGGRPAAGRTRPDNGSTSSAPR